MQNRDFRNRIFSKPVCVCKSFPYTFERTLSGRHLRLFVGMQVLVHHTIGKILINLAQTHTGAGTACFAYQVNFSATSVGIFLTTRFFVIHHPPITVTHAID